MLSAKSIRKVGVPGSGDQARAMLIAASKVRQLQRISVFSPTPAHRQAFAETIRREQRVNIEPVDRAEQAVVDCDLLISLFRAGREPFIAADWIAPSMHICAASSVRPGVRELEDGIWRKAAVGAGEPSRRSA
jgi:alanine dehydrogenase